MRFSRLTKPTLFFVAGILLLLYVLFEWLSNGLQVEGWVYRMGKLLMPLAIFMLVSDMVLKALLKKLVWIWIAEALLSLLIVYWLIIT